MLFVEKDIFGDFCICEVVDKSRLEYHVHDGSRISDRRHVNTMKNIFSYRINLMSVNGPISPKQCNYEMEYSFYSFYWLNSLEIWLDHNSTYYRSLSKNSDVKPHISRCDPQDLQYKLHPEFWPSHRLIFKTSLYYNMRLILENWR